MNSFSLRRPSPAPLCAWLAGAALLLAVPAHAVSAAYCDAPVPDIDCIDPALEPGSSLDMGAISPTDNVADIKPGEPVAIADDGEFDGVYQCSVSDPTSGSAQAYVSINGHASGEMIFILAGLDPRTDKYAGYGKGKFVGTTLSGTTNVGGAFTLQATMGTSASGDAQATLVGKVHAKSRDAALKPIEFDVAVNCVSIW